MQALNPVTEKLKATQAALQSLLDKKLSPDARDRLTHEALNRVKGALQLLEAEDPERRPYSSTTGAGLGKESSIVERHESFGLISVSKPTGSVRLFGAMADALPSFVELKIFRSRREVDTRMHTEHYYPDPYSPLLVLRMSTYQWADLICSMTGGLIACTLDSVLGVRMDPVPDEVKTPLEQIAHDTRAEMFAAQTEGEEKFLAAIDALLAKTPELKLSSKKEGELRTAIAGLRTHTAAVKATAVWAAQRLAEDTEKTVAQARIELAASFQSLVQRTGLQAIAGDLAGAVQSQIKELTNGDKEGR